MFDNHLYFSFPIFIWSAGPYLKSHQENDDGFLGQSRREFELETI